jgi:haloalkane dehalogenase
MQPKIGLADLDIAFKKEMRHPELQFGCLMFTMSVVIFPLAEEHLPGSSAGRFPDRIAESPSRDKGDRAPGSYSFFEHRSFLDALLDALDVHQRVTLVVNDLGALLGFDWANRHRNAVRGIAYMEAIVKPRVWSDWPDGARQNVQMFRSPMGEKMVLEGNAQVETVLPRSVLRSLTEEEMEHYRRPFAEPGEGRRPTLSWVRQIPIDGGPAAVQEVVIAYGEWLAHSDVPKLFLNADPGTVPQDARDFCRTRPAQSEMTIRGGHFPQEDSPDEIGLALANWLRTLN